MQNKFRKDTKLGLLIFGFLILVSIDVSAEPGACFDYYGNKSKDWLLSQKDDLSGLGKVALALSKPFQFLSKIDYPKTERLAAVAFFDQNKKMEAVNILYEDNYLLKHVYRITNHLKPRLMNTTLNIIFHVENGSLVATYTSEMTGNSTSVRWDLSTLNLGRKLLQDSVLVESDIRELNALSVNAFTAMKGWMLGQTASLFSKKHRESGLGARLDNDPNNDGFLSYIYPNGDRMWVLQSKLNGIDIYTPTTTKYGAKAFAINRNNDYTLRAKAFGSFTKAESDSLDLRNLSKPPIFGFDNEDIVYSLPSAIAEKIKTK